MVPQLNAMAATLVPLAVTLPLRVALFPVTLVAASVTIITVEA